MKILIKASTDKEYEAGGETFDGYMGATGWKGANYDIHMDIKDIAKIVRKQFKQRFPGYKLSVRIDRFSGGQAIDAMVWLHTSDLMSKDEFIKYAADDPWHAFKFWRLSYTRPDGTTIVVNQDDVLQGGQVPPEEYDNLFSQYYDYVIDTYSNVDNYHRFNFGEEPIPLKNREPLDYVKHLLDSFNYDDSNSMVDYFDVNFYSDISWKLD